VRRATRSDRQHRGGRVFSNTVQVDVVMSNHAAGAASPDPGSVGECLVGRHVPGVAVDRCASFGVVRAGSVLLPGLGETTQRNWKKSQCKSKNRSRIFKISDEHRSRISIPGGCNLR